MRKLLLLLSIMILSTVASAQYTYQIVLRNAAAPNSGTSANIIGSGAAFHNLTWNVGGTVSTCSVRVDGSADGVTWGTGDVIGATTCTSNGNTLSASHIVNYVRINLVTFTGTAPLFTANVSGYITQPSGGGTVTSVTCGTGLSGGTITSTGTCALANTAVTPGAYTTANITVDQQGRITAASNGAGGGYTTVQNNGSPVTQRAKINFISGTNITSNCVDNSGTSSTDCTISGATAVPGVPVNGNNTESASASGLSVLISPFAHAGDMFVTYCPFYSGAVGTLTVTDSQLLTWNATGNTGLNTSDFQSQMWVANATALGLGDTITCNVGGGGGSGHQAIAALEVAGSVVVDQSAFGNVNSAASGLTLSFTTTGTDTLLVMAYDADRSSVDAFTGLSGYTKVLFGNGSGGIYYALYYKTGVTSGAQSVTVTGVSTHPLHVAFIALK